MISLQLLQTKLDTILQSTHEAIDISVELRSQSEENKGEVSKMWGEFLGGLFGYIKQKSKESKDNLLAGVSWARMKLF
ncbi:MAG TPA: hypothetical protein VGL27_15385 [Negativicutes bacterium]|jgi:hypothetical protein